MQMRPEESAVTPAFRFTIFGEGSILSPNAIDDATFFVSQHYRDFLSREADPSGLSFWTNESTLAGQTPLAWTTSARMFPQLTSYQLNSRRQAFTRSGFSARPLARNRATPRA